MIKAIRRQGRQAGVVHMASRREVVERLKRHVIEPHYPMHRVIKKTADSGSPDAGRLRLQIEHLADHPCFPEESPIEPRSVPMQARFEFCDHPQGKRTVPGNILTATDLGSQLPHVALLEEKK